MPTVSELVTSRVFGAEADPTVYYACAYQSSIGQHRLPIEALKRVDFRVVAYAYDDRVLNSGQPEHLVEAVEQTATAVTQDMQDREIAGTYGVSFGSLIAANLVQLPGVPRAMINTGGVPASQAVWQSREMVPERERFMQNGFDLAALQARWAPVETFTAAGFAGKRLLLMSSTGDQIIHFPDVAKMVQELQTQGVDASLLTIRGLSHQQAIARNMFRFRLMRSFFRGYAVV